MKTQNYSESPSIY